MLQIRSKLVILCFLVFSQSAHAELVIPSGLTGAERGAILEILGGSSSSKILGDPYPLGGYSGLEIGFSTEILTTGDISRYGAHSANQSETAYSVFSIGKGIYNNLDTFINFSFAGQREHISSFGGQLRWSFFEARYLPIYLSLILHGNNTNFSNVLATRTQGLDIIAGFKEQDVTLYVGFGTLSSSGTFAGGTGGITQSGDPAIENATDTRIISGANIKFGDFFLALELDRFVNPVYSAKIGVRY
jgi:hypothetical protein